MNEQEQLQQPIELGVLADEMGHAFQFKQALSLIATIPPDFLAMSIEYMDSLISQLEDADEIDKMKEFQELYRLGIAASMRYRKVMKAEEKALRRARKESGHAAKDQGATGERRTPTGNEGEKNGQGKGPQGKGEEEEPTIKGQEEGDKPPEEEAPTAQAQENQPDKAG